MLVTDKEYREFPVAPFVGAWIEIFKWQEVDEYKEVAPFVGAWIEILLKSYMESKVRSLPSWERGLKFV